MLRKIVFSGIRVALLSGAATLIGYGLASGVFAEDPLKKVPELDPGSMSSALALLAGGTLMVTDRFVRRRAKAV